MSKIKYLKRAKKEKNDEFYTRIEDIENEMIHYENQFKGKTILMNCDDPTWSNFWKYFHMNFERLGIKKIIATHYEYNDISYKMEYMGDKDIKTKLKSNGDFRNAECIEILKEADIVITNPPFSLWREYIDLLTKYNKKFTLIGKKYDKKFIILGAFTALTYGNVISLIKDNKLWLGYNDVTKFNQPDGSIKNVECRWYTNLDVKNNKWIDTKYLYKPELYHKYDNCDAINVNSVNEIPMDYDGIMGVPITIFDKYNPKQFEIIGGLIPLINCKNIFKRILIRKKMVS